MIKRNLFLFALLIGNLIYAQNETVIIATLNGYCSGVITKTEISDNPEILVTSNLPNLDIVKIGLFSNTNQNCMEFWNKGGKLNSKMIERIQSLKDGDIIYFDIYVNINDSSTLIHPLKFKISNSKKKTCPCFVSSSANIKGVTHGKLSKKKLIREGKITISSNNQEVKLLNYKFSSVVKGEKREVACSTLYFNQIIKKLIGESHKSQRIYFSDILVSVNNKCFYMNPIEIQLE